VKPTKFVLRLTLLSLMCALLAWKALLPCYVAIAACYVSQAVCEVDRIIFSSSMNPFCKLGLLSHSPNHLHLTTPQTCPTAVLWAVKPIVSHTLMNLWGQTPVSFNRDYASFGGGAHILRSYTSQTHGLPPPSFLGSLTELIFGYNPRYANINGAGLILEASTEVGECWRISGGTGHVAINLSEPVFISHIAMDYASPSLLSEDDIKSAPKHMALWAPLPSTVLDDMAHELEAPIRSLKDFKCKTCSNDDLPTSSQLSQIIDFEYNILREPTRQIFQTPSQMRFPTQTVILEVKSNGGSHTTCIYWLGIYGSKSTF